VSVFSGPVQKKKTYPLMATGEYAATLLDLTYETGGAYGDSLLWKWNMALPESPTDYICRDDGDEKIIYEYTSPDVILGSKPHEWIASLTGHMLEDGEDPPDADDLLGKRMLVYLTHQAPKQGPNVGVLKERFVQGSSKQLKGVPGRPTMRSNPPRAEQPVADDERTALIAKAERVAGKAIRLETPSHQQWKDLDFGFLADDALEMVIRDAQAEVNAALDD
jgi:hypothetical protein